MVLLVSSAMNAERLVRIPAVTDSDFISVQSMGYDITAGSRDEGFVDVCIADRYVEETLQRYPDARLLPLEWSTLVSTDNTEMGYYYGPNENNVFWATLAESSDLVDTPVSYGTSFEGRDLYYVRISNAGAGAPAILFTALTHAREAGSNAVLIDFASWLSAEYGSDTMATFILDNSQVYFVPMINVDGYYYNLPSGANNHRKNMNFSDPVASSGIDLNRNFTYMWGYDNIGSSPDPYSETYRGHQAASEVETQALISFMQSINPIGGFHYHTYGGYLLYPYSYNNTPTPHQSTFQNWAVELTSQNNYQYGRCGEILYNANGDAIDWSYGENGYLFYTPEVDDNGFWGSQNDSTLLATNNLECRFMNKRLCMFLLNYTGISQESSEGTEESGLYVSLSENPVSSVLSYEITGAGNVTVSILDVSGRTIAYPSDGTWAVPRNIPDGVYLIRAETASSSVTERFTVLR